MQLPGQTINPDDFNVDYWKANAFENSDPEYNAFLLTDSIPVSSLPYYVDSGKKISNMYKRFLENYITENRKIQSEEDLARYKKALKRIMNDDYTPSPLAVYVNTTRNIARETYANIVNLRNECLNTDNYGICQRKAVYWNEETQDNHMLYMVTQKELLSAQAKVLAMQFRSFDLILMQAYELFMSSARSCVGAKSFLGDYLQVRYDPADYWKWWEPNTTISTFNTAFTTVNVYTREDSKETSESMSKTSWGVSAAYNTPMVRVSGSVSSDNTNRNFQALTKGSSSTITFEIAPVKVIRPWFDSSLFNLAPLGIKGAPKYYWSDGNFKGTFPWFVSKMIVAKNIIVKQSSWSDSVKESFSASSLQAGFSVGYGPFSCSGDYSQSNSKADKAKSFEFKENTLTVGGPQIIGFVMTKIVPFPNYDDGDFNLKSLDQ